ncbi:hypothetical protein [Microbacterium paludicola]|uniref:hypothetical protein n=1 Tax=Microbacterium paludicola TaxID=300019 RepID=UPI0031D0F328
MTEGTRPRVTRWAFALLATVPVALFASMYLVAGITIGWCGISGCSGGGYGLTSDPSEFFTFGCAALAALLWLAALALPPWLLPTRLRMIVAAIVALVLALAMLLIGTSGFARA